MQAAVDFPKAVATFRGEDAFAFTRNEDSRPTPPVWEYFFSASTTIVSPQDKDRYIVGYYNPFLDATVLTWWTMTGEGGQVRLVAASLQSGREFEAGQITNKSERPRWLTSQKSPPEALSDQYRLFIATFHRRFPQRTSASSQEFLPTSSATRDAVLGQSTVAMLALYTFQRKLDPKVVKLLNDFRSALYDADEASLGQMLSKESQMSGTEIAALPEQFREDAVAVYALGSGHEVALIMCDPKFPNLCAVMRYQTEPPGKILSFDLFDMSVEPTKGVNP